MIQQLFERASLLFEQKRYSEAKKVLLEILASEPDHTYCTIMLVEIKIEEEEYVEAMQLLDSAIAQDPEIDILFYLKAKINLAQEKSDEAIENLNTAISIDPYDANNFAFLGHILLYKKKFSEALKTANDALELDPTHVFALNVRSTALLKLNQKDDSFETILEALNNDPNNSFTHANYGWNLLEKGQTDKALSHFSESLKNNPNSEYAQSGMAEALKSKYFVYRWFLKYSFWMSNLTSKNQWIFIIGFYLISRLFRTLAESNPELEPILTPITYLLAGFAISTWLMTPLSNLMFRLNKYGQHLLSDNEKKSSNLVGISLLCLFFGLGFYLITDSAVGIAFAFFGFTMMLPLARFFDKPAAFFRSYIFGLLLLGILSLTTIFLNGNIYNLFSILYFFGFFGFQWAANYFAMRQK